MSADMDTGKTGDTAITPYLFFGGRCEEALQFYKTKLGATIDIMLRFNESPEPPPPGVVPPGFETKIMHASLRIHGAAILASDGCRPDDAGFKGFSLCLTVGDESTAHSIFDTLATGGKVNMPLSKTFWSPCYGMVTDPFGIDWMVMVPEQMD